MPIYRKLNKEELAELIGVLCHEENIDSNAIRTLVKDFYPSTAHKIICFFGNEYNDETYDLKLESLEVFDVDNKELARNGEGDDVADDEFYSAKYNLGDIASDISENEESFSYTIFMSRKNQPKTLELYVQDSP